MSKKVALALDAVKFVRESISMVYVSLLNGKTYLDNIISSTRIAAVTADGKVVTSVDIYGTHSQTVANYEQKLIAKLLKRGHTWRGESLEARETRLDREADARTALHYSVTTEGKAAKEAYYSALEYQRQSDIRMEEKRQSIADIRATVS